MSLWLVGLGGVAGAVARVLVGERVERHARDTLLVNVAGSFLLGVVTTAPVPEPVALLVGVGFCGAFTTFSTFAVETVGFLEAGDPRRALRNAGGSLAAALLAVGVGFLVGGLL
ncbi:fluoride efflux transporter FluC [Natronomonas sp. EA1]|uniref:fluoride efflux transporter FluC n=1 Tax=Natronomonas sp. EA1 TaxID=3421655 RepID=UPI003EBC0DEA